MKDREPTERQYDQHFGDRYSRVGPLNISVVRDLFRDPVTRDAVFQAEVYLREVVAEKRAPRDEPAILQDPIMEAFLTQQREEFGGRSILAAIRYVIEEERKKGQFIPADRVPKPELIEIQPERPFTGDETRTPMIDAREIRVEEIPLAEDQINEPTLPDVDENPPILSPDQLLEPAVATMTRPIIEMEVELTSTEETELQEIEQVVRPPEQTEARQVIPRETVFGGTLRPGPKDLVRSLRGIQEKAGVNQKQMAETLGVSSSMLSKVFSGTRPPPSNLEFYTNLRNLPNIMEEDLNLWTIPGSLSWGTQEFRAQAKPVEGINFVIYADPKVLDDEQVIFLRDEISEAIKGVIERTEARRQRIRDFYERRESVQPSSTEEK